MNQTFIKLMKLGKFEIRYKKENRANGWFFPFAINFNGNSTYSQSQSLRLSTVYRCVQVISEAVATLPLEPYAINKDGYKTKLVGSELFNLLSYEPNQFISRFIFFKTIVSSLLLKGNAYIRIIREGYAVKELQLLQTDAVLPVLVDNDIKYQYSITGETYNKADIIHLMNYWDGVSLTGNSVIEHAVYTLQLTSDSEAHARGFFKGGANLGGVIKTQTQLTKDKADLLKTSFQNAFNTDTGTPNGIAILDSGMEYSPISVKPSDAQLLETRKFNVVEICRFFGVHPTKVFDTTGSTYSNVENYQLAFLTDTLTPLLEKIENEFHRKLILPSQRSAIELKFDVTNLLRADSLTQADYYTKMFQLGAYSPNDIRKKIGQPSIEGGNRCFIQQNLQPIDNITNDTKNPKTEN